MAGFVDSFRKLSTRELPRPNSTGSLKVISHPLQRNVHNKALIMAKFESTGRQIGAEGSRRALFNSNKKQQFTFSELSMKVGSDSEDESPCRNDFAWMNKVVSLRKESKFRGSTSQHPNVAILGITDPKYLDETMDLFKFLHHSPLLSFRLIREWSRCLLQAVAYMHENGFVHQVHSTHQSAKLCDFGVARKIDEKMIVDREVGILWYRAPELLMGAPYYTQMIDEWGLGCVVLEMIMGCAPFTGKRGYECSCKVISHINFNSDQLAKIFIVLGSPDLSLLSEHQPTCLSHFSTWSRSSRKLEQKIIDGWERRRGDEEEANHRDDIKFAHEVSHLITFVQGLLEYDPSQRTAAASALGQSMFTETSSHSREALRRSEESLSSDSLDSARASLQSSLSEANWSNGPREKKSGLLDPLNLSHGFRKSSSEILRRGTLDSRA